MKSKTTIGCFRGRAKQPLLDWDTERNNHYVVKTKSRTTLDCLSGGAKQPMVD